MRSVFERVWAFDSEWVPDPISGKLLYNLPDQMSDADILAELWRRNGATEEDPTPFLRTALCRIVSLVVLERHAKPGAEVKLRLVSFPDDVLNADSSSETHIIRSFLSGVGRYRPQVVGFNSYNSDLKIVVQRGIANGMQAKEYCTRPTKPWEGNDYFARGNDCNIDLMDIVGGFGRSIGVTLNEMAVVCGIPGKLGTSGDDVAGMWLNGKLKEIVEYNQYDAFTTYLLWLRVAHFAGLFTTAEYLVEQERVEELLGQLISFGAEHLQLFLSEWRRLRNLRTTSNGFVNDLVKE